MGWDLKKKKKTDFHSLGSAENKPIVCPGHLYMGKGELEIPQCALSLGSTQESLNGVEHSPSSPVGLGP